jgi:hypothetical protein
MVELRIVRDLRLLILLYDTVPLCRAVVGAEFGQTVHSFEEQGMSCLR